MKKTVFIILLTLNQISLNAQMTASDSALCYNLWNGVSWSFSSNNYPVEYNYSNGTNYLKMILNPEGRLVQAKTYYYDGSIAMFSKLYSNPDSLKSQNPLDMDFKQINYYPNGQVRMIKYNFSETKLTMYYGENTELFHIDQIIFKDTICGIFLTAFDTDYNYIFRVYEHGTYLGNMVIDSHNKLVKSDKDIPDDQLKVKYAILIETKNNPYNLK